VVSATVGRTTGTPSTSDWNCIRVSLKTMPPSTLSEVSATPESAFIASTISRVCQAGRLERRASDVTLVDVARSAPR